MKKIHIENISVENIKSLLLDSEFTRLWNVNKDKIEICRDCEFRYLCVDDRIPIQKSGFWMYVTECSYNPYITKWQGEEGYVPIEECGTYSKEIGFIPNHGKITKLNEVIWGGANE